MLEACLPLGPCVTSNWTFWPSLRVLKPFMLIAEKWANKSSPPSSGVMKPKPLESLNHLTVPVAIKRTFKINTNHTSHKSKKLLAPSSTSHFLSSCTLLQQSIQHCWRNKYWSQALFHSSWQILHGDQKSNSWFSPQGRHLRRSEKTRKIENNWKRADIAHDNHCESIRISVWQPSTTPKPCWSGR